MNQPNAKLSKTDWRRVKKVATGPLLGPVPGQPAAREGQSAPARVARLGEYAAVRAKLSELLPPEKAR